MEGFKSTMENTLAYREGRIIKNNGNITFKKDVSHVVSQMLKFQIDAENDVYFITGYGAFKNNIDMKVKSVEELKNFMDKKTKEKPYAYLSELEEKGYKFVIGPAFPKPNGAIGKNSVGLFCKNYLEMIEKEQQNETINNI